MNELAIVGAGNWGENLIREFNDLSNTELQLTTVVTESTKRHDELNQTYPHLKVTINYREVLANESIQAVVIATPTSTHFELAKKALKAKKNVFVEKPPAQTTLELEQLIALARKKEKVLFTDHIFLYHPLIKEMDSLLGEGEVEWVRVDWLKWGSFHGDIFEDLAYHELYLAQTLFGSVRELEILEKIGVITETDIITFKLFMSDNIEYVVHIDRVKPGLKSKVTTFKTNTGLFLLEDEQIKSLNSENLEEEVISTNNQKPLPLVCRDFLQRVRSREVENPDFELMINTMQLIDQLKKADLDKKVSFS